jgi:hypothetical protein
LQQLLICSHLILQALPDVLELIRQGQQQDDQVGWRHLLNLYILDPGQTFFTFLGLWFSALPCLVRGGLCNLMSAS